jgi:hypothetical protein
MLKLLLAAGTKVQVQVQVQGQVQVQVQVQVCVTSMDGQVQPLDVALVHRRFVKDYAIAVPNGPSLTWSYSVVSFISAQTLRLVV